MTSVSSTLSFNSSLMNDAHLPIAAFGGTFLMMVGLTYFFNHEKEVHWIGSLERIMARSAAIKGIEIAFVLLLILLFSSLLEGEDATTFVYCAIYGLVTFLVVEVIGGLLDASQRAMSEAAKGGLGAFIYLEVLDASFSFDGVIGAFALTQNLFIIAIGLGIGAMAVLLGVETRPEYSPGRKRRSPRASARLTVSGTGD